jgi:hypothetical protein
LVIGSWLTHRHLLKMIGAKWLFQDVGIPFGLSLLVGILGSHLILGAGLPLYANLLYGTALPLVAFLLILAVSPELRFVLFERLGWNKAVARRDLEEL